MENKLSTSQRIISYLNIALRIVIIVLIVILLHSIYKGLQQDGYIIQTIQTPKALTDSGFNGVVLANKLQDKIKLIKSSVNSSRQDSLVISANSTSDLKMDVMGIGVSSTSLIYHLRDLLHIETKTIRGDLTDLDAELTMTTRVHDFPVKTISESYNDIARSDALESLITKVAEHILSCTDPYYQVINLYDSERYEDAHLLIREMINNRPGEAKWGYLAWGNMKVRQNESEKSKEYFLKSIDVDNDFFLPNKAVAWSYYNEEEFEKAIEHFEKALNSEPNDFEAINGIAMSYRDLGQNKRSESYFKLNVDRNTDIIWAYMAYADFYTDVIKDTLGAIKIFNQAKNQVTQNDDYYMTQAGYYFFQNKLDTALIYLNKSLDFNPKNETALFQMIGYLTSSEIGNYKESIKYQKRLVKLQKERRFGKFSRIHGLNRLAMAEWKINEFDSAFAHVQLAIDMEPSYPIPYTTLAEIHLAMGNVKQFYRTFQKAFDLGLEFEEEWFEDEPYASIKNDLRFMNMLEKSEKNRKVLKD